MNTDRTTRPLPELLSPAGDWEAMRAAVANGADAVYFGLSHFNARARATNFTLEELPEVMQFLHARNVRGFVTMNTLVFCDELAEAQHFLKTIAEAGVDAIIVQDLGIVDLIRHLAPTLAVHGSTQMTLTEPRGISVVQKLGVQRVVLARELSLDEIRKVTSQTAMPVEVFIHGALCVAYSGQCLTSEAIGGRSANRGQCAQACRLPYEMIVDGQPRDLGDKAYLLSPQDLAAYELIDPLIAAGVISFKIEGRLKGGPYVASTTQTYRKAIDAALDKQEFHLTRREELDLAQTFSRGLTPGFLEGVNHQKLVRGRFPKSRGIRIGTVAGFTNHGVRIAIAETVGDLVKPGDGVLFDLGTPEVKEPGGRVWGVRPAVATPTGATCVELQFEPESMDFDGIPIGCDVWKTDDPALRKRLEHTYSQDKLARRAAITATLQGTLAGSVTLTFRDDRDHEVTATWPGPLEQAKKRATTATEIQEQLGRLGDTPFELKETILQLPDNVMLPKSVLNELRRQAATQLAEHRLQLRKHAVVNANALAQLRADRPKPDANPTPTLTVMTRNLQQLEAVLAWESSAKLPKPSLVYCDFEDLRRYKDAVPMARNAGMPIGLASLRIWKPGEDGFQSLIVRAAPDFVLVRNLAGISYFQEQLPASQLIGDFSLNIANDLTARVLKREGLLRMVPSFDLNWEQFQALMRSADPRWFEPVVHQHMPMFHMEHCVFAAFLSTGKDHRDCGRPCDQHRIELKDRVGALFPVHPDTGCRNTVFNSVPQSAAEYIGRMRQLGVSAFRIDLLRETAEQTRDLLDHYTRIIHGLESGHDTWRQFQALNQLGVTRGTLQMA